MVRFNTVCSYPGAIMPSQPERSVAYAANPAFAASGTQRMLSDERTRIRLTKAGRTASYAASTGSCARLTLKS